MGKIVVVHKCDSFDELLRDFLSLFFADWPQYVLFQIAMLEIFHGNEDGLGGLVPAVRPDEAVNILHLWMSATSVSTSSPT